jgi:hypothetical protein
MSMTWYFAISESSIDRGEHDWRGLIRAAVKSAYRNTRLRPTLLYDGEPSEFTAELENTGVRIIQHGVSFFDELARHSDAIGDPWWLKIASGTFLRTEIPILRSGPDMILYTDCDVMFMRDPGVLDCGKAPFAVVPEYDNEVVIVPKYDEGVVGGYTNINSGVMVMNVSALRDSFTKFREFIRYNLDKFEIFDQSAYQQFYAGQWKELEPEFNWRPYWGFNDMARIVHWHGPKPPFVRRLQQGTDVRGYDVWRGDYDRAPGSYAKYLSIRDEYSERPVDARRYTAKRALAKFGSLAARFVGTRARCG